MTHSTTRNCLAFKRWHTNKYLHPNAAVLVFAASSACQYSIHNVTYKMRPPQRTKNHVSIFPQRSRSLSLFLWHAALLLSITLPELSSAALRLQKSMGCNFSVALKRLRVNGGGGLTEQMWGCFTTSQNKLALISA